MSWAKAAKKASRNLGIDFDGNNSEGWIPRRKKYPHVHFGGDFIRFRHSSGGGGSVLADGQTLLPPIHNVINELDDGDVRAVLQALVDQYPVG